ncbi:hypothetical protein [Lactobacillus johnsonii]|uniref:hypothetical protein n=1 Tax=Lactobacillus johnsonii TaxID=33959 RepID=UPI0021A669B5|nr:hypothetical protein [Lactobacillus johnsonii]MCT3385476.1 hypothetical protein [Lactobacillus johnsonii]
MGRYNLKNDRRNKKYEHDELDVTRLSRELIRPKSANYGDRRESNHSDKVGVSLQLMSGQFLKTAEFTVDDIAEALDRGKRWLKQKNGGAINLGYVVSYSPYKFYSKDDSRPGKQRYEY